MLDLIVNGPVVQIRVQAAVLVPRHGIVMSIVMLNGSVNIAAVQIRVVDRVIAGSVVSISGHCRRREQSHSCEGRDC
jgi:hypothetical protein